MSLNESIRQRRPLRQPEVNDQKRVSSLLKNSNEKSSERWYCSSHVVFVLLFSIRLVSAFYNLIWDCDETYNYWEPLHYTLYTHGSQTWEYSPEFSLRSYLYIYIHTWCLLPFKYLGFSKVQLFFTLRIIFALISAKFETNFVKATSDTYGQYVSKLVFFFLFTNVGMFLSSTSFLPSSFSMLLLMNSYAYWLNGHFKSAIVYVALSALLGWPFVSILGIPIILDIVLNMNYKRIFQYFGFCALVGVILSGTIISFDSYFYGCLQFAPLNIILYNVFPKSTSHGPDIYGREPLNYYLVNLALNNNILFPLGLLNLVILVFSKTILKQKLIFLAFSLWLMVFFTRPHKEERFLYPIYPLIILLASHTLNYFSSKLKYLSKFMPIFLVIMHACLCALRLIALQSNYSGQMEIFMRLNEPQVKYSVDLHSKDLVQVCIGKEWYRYPSSFFLPESYSRQKWRLKFVKSNFKGQLPGDYNETLNIPESTRWISNEFNDVNAEVKSRYVTLDSCDYFIDTLSDSDLEKFTRDKWKSIYNTKFIDFDASISFYRAIYLPKYYEKYTKFTKFYLLKRLG